ncbi:ATP-binding protein [Anaeroselena agilis]|uniref:histidine kinase n=1 Tax=Anaeroselena agilis TaxID=3063788 RepID=A0ABU3NZ60_9FIRM|nr:ATP-binding protein [Selenomonadales bacterium 4137-cl]
MDWSRLVGDEASYPLEHRILNTVLLIGILISLVTVGSNYLLGFRLPMLLSVVGCVVLGASYYLSVAKRAYRAALLPGVGFAFATFPALWIANDGIFGSVPFYIIVFAAMISVSVRNVRWIFALVGGMAAVTVGLMATEYYFPQVIATNPNRGELFMDNFIGLMAAVVVVTTLYVVILNYYRREHRRATDYLVRLERQEIALELARLDRLNLIGEMAASIGHEVRNPLTTIKGYLQFFRNKQEYSRYCEHFDLMIGELNRANAIITEFLSLAKNKRAALAPCNLNQVLERIFPLIQAGALADGKELALKLGKSQPVEADEGEVRQLVLNLAGNALDAVERGGRVTVGTYRDGRQTVLFVSDTGGGIPPEIYAKLGTPFVTSKEKGTGLGIPICFRIAERHGAMIEVDTGATGTTFRVRFPATGPRETEQAGA